MPDQRIIDVAQSLYDHIFDRTGLYKGHILYLAVMLYVGLSFIFDNPRIYDLIFLIYFVALSGFGWWLNSQQRARNYQWLNLYAHRCSCSPMLFAMRVAAWFMIGYRCLMRDSDWVITLGFIIILFFYLSCVKVRDREPPEMLDAAFNRG